MSFKVLAAAQDWKTGSTGGDAPASFADVEVIFSNILGFIIPFFGIALFIIILIGGFKYLTAGGDQNKVKEGGDTLTWGVVGLITVLCIWFIMMLIENFTGVPVTKFEIPK